MTGGVLLGNTESVCPECLKRVQAQKIAAGASVYLQKECPEHGSFRTLIWQGEPSYAGWSNPKIPSAPAVCTTRVEQGCPFDCGLCPGHRQETCCVLLEVTTSCNLQCPICFAAAESGKERNDPDLAEIEGWYQALRARGIDNIQLSGGEPTVRDDLPEIVARGRKSGFPYIQLNTNGLRLGQDPHYAEQLKEAGLNSVFLQFDGIGDEINKSIRGAALADIKEAAIDHCARQGIGVVLVPTLVPGINMNGIGDILNFAIARIPAVRGVHFQPISYFGRYPPAPPADRITIPEILRGIEKQSGGKLKAENFLPPAAENSYCSFHGNFILMEDGRLKPWTSSQGAKSCCRPASAAAGLKRSREFVARQWTAPNAARINSCLCTQDNAGNGEINVDSLDQFLVRVRDYSLSISGMAFQDAWTLDLERLRDCKVHVFSPDNRLIPFCAFNLTAVNGRSLYRI
ncbi:MAG: radical SAM (seleno)protein TrsS [Peptococcaceae bacterium]